MKLREAYELPEKKQQQLRRAVRLEWITIGSLLVIAAMMYLVMGSSQTMKTAWFEDLISLVPPIVFLVSARFRDRGPTEDFPYGFRRAPLLAFLAASVAVLTLGLYMIGDNAVSLVTAEHPTIGHYTMFGGSLDVWSGWLMIGALVLSMIPPFVLGRLKLPLGRDLHEKTLYADAVMNKADWMTAAAAVAGILAVGAGLWWGDAVAALIIATDVTKDGVTNVRNAIKQLLDHRPTKVGSEEPLPIESSIVAVAVSFDFVAHAEVRLREEGHVFSGELFVTVDGGSIDTSRLRELHDAVADLDWRLHEVVVVPG